MERFLQLHRGPTTTNTTKYFVDEHQHQEEEEEEEKVEEDNGCSFLLNSTEEEEKLKLVEEEEEKQQNLFRLPFLEMLQSVESPTPLSSFAKQPHLQQLLSSTLQHQRKHWGDLSKEMELQSRETKEEKQEYPHPMCSSSNSVEIDKSSSTTNVGFDNTIKCEETAAVKEERNNKRKRSSTTSIRARAKARPRAGKKKKKEDTENQRMTHITVERNRRKQMKDHLNALASLMPCSLLQRGDQASIIGGAIDLVKELEQLLQSLEAHKRMRSTSSELELEGETRSKSLMGNGFFPSPQGVDIQATVNQSHVNLKILISPTRGRGGGELVRIICALEDIRLTVLHLNVTSFDHSVLYSFNLKIEQGCEVGRGDEIAAAVSQIFN